MGEVYQARDTRGRLPPQPFGRRDLDRDVAAEADANSPTVLSPVLTERGLILGTALYTAPEQAMGRPVDRRADIWAFGVVLFELLTGRKLFGRRDHDRGRRGGDQGRHRARSAAA